MEEIIRESERLKRVLDDVCDKLEALLDACEHIGAEGAASSADEALDLARSAADVIGDIFYEF